MERPAGNCISRGPGTRMGGTTWIWSTILPLTHEPFSPFRTITAQAVPAPARTGSFMHSAGGPASKSAYPATTLGITLVLWSRIRPDCGMTTVTSEERGCRVKNIRVAPSVNGWNLRGVPPQSSKRLQADDSLVLDSRGKRHRGHIQSAMVGQAAHSRPLGNV